MLWIPGRLPGRNELDQSNRSAVLVRDRGGRVRRVSRYSRDKNLYENRIAFLARAKLEPMDSAWFTYLLVEPDRRRDPSNVLSGAMKFVEDALQKAGILKNDGWSEVLGITPYWIVSKKPGVLVSLDEGPRGLDEMMEEWKTVTQST